MGQWALQFTPEVCLGQHPQVLLLEVAASLRLWGGRSALLSRLESGLFALGWPEAPSLGLGSTPRAAEWRACWLANSPGAASPSMRSLGELPLGLIPEAEPHLATLQGMGLWRVQDLRPLPRGGLRRRFGPALLQALDAAVGEAADPRQPLQAPLQFSQSIELPEPSANIELLLLGIERLWLACQAWLVGLQMGLLRLRLVLHQGRQGQDTQALLVGLSEPTQQGRRVMHLVRERLSATTLHQAVHALGLEVVQAQPWDGQTPSLFPGMAQAQQDLRSLCERLEARLGPDQVCVLRLHDSHCPEAAGQMHPLPLGQALPKPSPSRWPAVFQRPAALQPLRPLWLLDAPQALRVLGHRPCLQGQPLRLRLGPERIESQWWEAPLRRDYFVAEAPDQRLVWIYRTPEHSWFLHGHFG